MESEGSLSYSQTSFTGPHHEPAGFGLHRLILFVYVHPNNIFPVDYFLHVAQTFLSFLMSVRPSILLSSSLSARLPLDGFSKYLILWT